MTKRRVRDVGEPKNLVFKVPTADLEADAPLRPDEEVYGVTYEKIDEFLEGKPISEVAEAAILENLQDKCPQAVSPYRSGGAPLKMRPPQLWLSMAGNFELLPGFAIGRPL